MSSQFQKRRRNSVIMTRTSTFFYIFYMVNRLEIYGLSVNAGFRSGKRQLLTNGLCCSSLFMAISDRISRLSEGLALFFPSFLEKPMDGGPHTGFPSGFRADPDWIEFWPDINNYNRPKSYFSINFWLDIKLYIKPK